MEKEELEEEEEGLEEVMGGGDCGEEGSTAVAPSAEGRGKAGDLKGSVVDGPITPLTSSGSRSVHRQEWNGGVREK